MPIGAGCQRADKKETGEQSPSMLSSETLSRKAVAFNFNFLFGVCSLMADSPVQICTVEGPGH